MAFALNAVTENKDQNLQKATALAVAFVMNTTYVRYRSIRMKYQELETRDLAQISLKIPSKSVMIPI